MIDVQGHVSPGFEPVRDAFAANFEAGGELGAAFAAVRDGDVLVNLWAGEAVRGGGRPWAADTIAPVFSTTKPIASLVVARLVAQGALDYERPVAAYWPEFGAHGKDRLTVAQMMSHQAGLVGFAEPIAADLWLDPPALAARLAAMAPFWPPGTAHGYHPSTWGYFVGELVARAAGKSLGTILREEICRPLGIDFHVGLPESEHERVADMQRPSAPPDLGPLTDLKRFAFLTKWAGPDRRDPRWKTVEIPSANGHGGALAVARLYAAYACEGRIEGREIVAPEAFAALTRTRAEGPDLVLPFDLAWAAGVMRNTLGVYGPNRDGFGHSGWGGSMGLADPARRLSAAYVMNRQSNALQGDPRATRLVSALYACL